MESVQPLYSSYTHTHTLYRKVEKYCAQRYRSPVTNTQVLLHLFSSYLMQVSLAVPQEHNGMSLHHTDSHGGETGVRAVQ